MKINLKKIACISSLLVFVCSIGIYGEEHVHTEECYKGYAHTHTEECYGEGTDYRECGGELEWKKVDTITKKCPYCDIVGSSYDVYEATCPVCGMTYKHYTEIEKLENTFHVCEKVPEGIELGLEIPKTPKDYPNRTNNKDTRKFDFSGIGPSCGKEEGQYYLNDKPVEPICNKIITGIEATVPNQTTNTPNLNINITFLDGHIEKDIKPKETTYKENEPYNNTEIKLIYFGQTKDAENTALTCVTKITNDAGINLANGIEPETEEEIEETTEVVEEKVEEKENVKIYPIKKTIITIGILFLFFLIGKIFVKTQD